MKNKKRMALFLVVCALGVVSSLFLWRTSEIKAEKAAEKASAVQTASPIQPVITFPGVTWEPTSIFESYGVTVAPFQTPLKNGIGNSVSFGNNVSRGKEIPKNPSIEDLKWFAMYTVEGFPYPFANAFANDLSDGVLGGYEKTTAPLIFGQGEKIQEPLNEFGHGDPFSLEPAAILSNVVFSRGKTPETAPAVGGKNGYDYLKVEYELRNNPAVTTGNTFPYHVKVVTETTGSKSARLKYSTTVTNIGTEELTDFVLGSRFDTDFLSMSTTGKDVMPVRFLGNNRGVSFDNYQPPTKKLPKVALNFYFDSKDRPDNWSVKQLVPNGQVEKFYDPAYTNFSGPTSTGQEAGYYPVTDPSDLVNAPYAYSPETKAASVSEDYNTAVYMKKQPKTLKVGASTGYTFDISAAIQVADRPYLSLEEDVTYYDGNTHTVQGSVVDYAPLASKIDIQYSMNENGPFKSAVTVPTYKSGTDAEWSFEVPESDLKPAGKKIIYFKAVNNLLKQSAVLNQVVLYNSPPAITLDKSVNWFMEGSDFTVTGDWTEVDPEDPTVNIYYSFDDGQANILANNSDLSNNPANTKRPFSGKITPAEHGNTYHKLSVWAEDSRGSKSTVESFNIGPHNIPNISASLALDKTEITEGETVAFTSTFKNTTLNPSLFKGVTYKTTEPFPENVTVDLDSVKLNGQPVPKADIVLGSARRLNVKLGDLDPVTDYNLTFDVIPEKDTMPLTTPLEVKQAFTVTGTTLDGSTITGNSGELKSFTIKPGIATIDILHLEDESEAKLEDEPARTDIIGKEDTIFAKVIKGYILSKVVIDGVEQTPLQSEVKVKYGTAHKVTFYYTGVLEFKSVPISFDFGTKSVNEGKNNIRVNKAALQGSLIVSDTRLNTKTWKLTAKLATPLTSEDGKIILTNAIRFKNPAKTEEFALTNEAQELVSHKNNSAGEYDVSATWGEERNSPGFKFEIPAVKVSQLGNYTATIEYKLEDTFTP